PPPPAAPNAAPVARRGITPPPESVADLAARECVDPRLISAGMADGTIVVLPNAGRSEWTAIGRGMTTKVNANVGTSADCRDYADVLRKADIAVRAGAHTLMDLSTIGLASDTDFAGGIRAVAEAAGVPVGTVPVYEAARRSMIRTGSNRVDLDWSEMIDAVHRQAEAGSVYMAIHAGLNRKTLEVWRSSPRNIVSKGGYITAEYMMVTGNENPFYEHFDELLGVLAHHGVCLNIGSALRSGATRFNDDAMFAEIECAAELARRAAERGVQAVLEGPGHVPLARIKEVVDFQRMVSGERPFFILGFVASDSWVGRDHIVSAIGAAEAVRHGVGWLCYITPAEHVRMPNDADVREGVMAFRIAAHIGDCATGQPAALALEATHNDKGCLDVRARRKFCSICGQDFCPIQRLHDLRIVKGDTKQ
ncbi:MAG: phosphomethylpyrimidine synthase ThiC, partial [Phycisphaerales bacterium]|nr:phosphomethylpyrimidine synthase ThiC [Phycisphaerales bacterium]